MSEVVSRFLPHRQLWASNLYKVAAQWLEVDSNLRPSGCKAQNIPLHHRVPFVLYYLYTTTSSSVPDASHLAAMSSIVLVFASPLLLLLSVQFILCPHLY